MKTVLPLLLCMLGCSSSPPPPVDIDTTHDICTHCRMVVSDRRLAAQIVAANEEPQLFDDIGCLRDYLAGHPRAAGSVVYVADHVSGRWLDARAALFTRALSRQTPMASGILAHADRASRDGDPAAAAGMPVDAAAILGPASVPKEPAR